MIASYHCRRKEIEASIRLQVAAEEKAYKVVEKLVLDEQFSEEFLVASVSTVSEVPSPYEQVTFMADVVCTVRFCL